MARITNSNPLSLSNVGKGEVIQRFDDAVAAALKNIKNPSTSQKKPREINIKAKLTPFKDREGAHISIAVDNKFPAVEPYESQLVITKKPDGEIVAHETMSTDSHPDLENI